jgi:hypothetical protein
VVDDLDLQDPDVFEAQAEQFADELSGTVQAVFGPDVSAFAATVSPGKDRVMAAFVRQAGDEGIHLSFAGSPFLTMQVRMRLTPDSANRHLRAVSSKFDVTPYGGTEPVFRYEYERDMEPSCYPAAHVQFHGRQEQLEAALVRVGRKRTKSSSSGGGLPNVTDLHFPLGGTRFRPCFEDLLEMLLIEFRLDVPDRDAALAAIGEGRARWRDLQLRAAVRDDMECAAAVLRAHGYQVNTPDPAPPPNADRLRRI